MTLERIYDGGTAYIRDDIACKSRDQAVKRARFDWAAQASGDFETVPVGTMAELERVREERDALAAHVERLKEAGSNMDGAKGCERAVAGVRWCRLIESGPQTSLARLKAEWDQDELQPIWETIIKVADMLGIDPEKARRAGGKPSETYAAHLTRRKAEWQAEGVDLFADQWGWGEFRPDEADVRKWAAKLRQQSEEADQ